MSAQQSHGQSSERNRSIRISNHNIAEDKLRKPYGKLTSQLIEQGLLTKNQLDELKEELGGSQVQHGGGKAAKHDRDDIDDEPSPGRNN